MKTTSTILGLPRRRAFAAVGLVLATIVTAAATRRRPVVPEPPPAGSTRFTAPGGGPVTFSGTLDRTAVKVGGDGLVRMELVLGGERPASTTARVPTDLVVVLDRSGSMSGEPMAHAQGAVRDLIGRLEPGDRFALVTYSDGAELAIPFAAVEPEARRRWISTVDAIAAGGNTNMAAGLDVALGAATAARGGGRVGRMILVSDGFANHGDATPEGLARRAGRVAQAELVLTTVGVGASFNENLMTALADAGTGNYYYVERATDLGDVFAREFGAARATVASAVAVEIEPSAGVRVVDAAGYPLEVAGDRVTFRPGTLFAGQERRVWVTFALPHDAPADHALGTVAVAYHVGETTHRLALTGTPRVACVADDDAFFASVDVSTWERAVVVEGYNKMEQDVARQVKDGDRAAARESVRRFRDEAAAMNGRVKSAAVAEQLDGLRELEAKVDDAFQGADQNAKQNALGKSRGAAAYDARRKGSKY